MNIESCFELGHVKKAHGTKGEVHIFLDVDQPQEYLEMESVFLLTGDGLVPFFIEYINTTPAKDRLNIKFEGISDIKEANKLKGSKLYLPTTALPELENNQFYYHEIKGFMVIDENLGELGIVEGVFEAPINDMLGVNVKGKEVLIPLSDAIYKSIDKEKKCIFVDTPNGLVDIYLNDTQQDEN